jgi:hypothetical protein
MNGDEALARSTARLLQSASPLLPAGLALSLLALAALLLTDGYRGWLLWLAALLAVPALWTAMRIRFDARLFLDFADGAGEPIELLRALDRSLASLGLRAAAEGEPRSLADRARGARTLVLRQLAIVAAQFALALAAAWPVHG